jgi:hypothetical protein
MSRKFAIVIACMLTVVVGALVLSFGGLPGQHSSADPVTRRVVRIVDAGSNPTPTPQDAATTGLSFAGGDDTTDDNGDDSGYTEDTQQEQEHNDGTEAESD